MASSVYARPEQGAEADRDGGEDEFDGGVPRRRVKERSCGPWFGGNGAAYAALVAVQLSYCVWHVLGKLALNGGTNPFVLAAYRQVGACCCLLGLSKYADFRHGSLVDAARRLSRRDAVRFVVLGALGFGNIFGFVVALSLVTAFNSALLHPASPSVLRPRVSRSRERATRRRRVIVGGGR